MAGGRGKSTGTPNANKPGKGSPACCDLRKQQLGLERGGAPAQGQGLTQGWEQVVRPCSWSLSSGAEKIWDSPGSPLLPGLPRRPGGPRQENKDAFIEKGSQRAWLRGACPAHPVRPPIHLQQLSVLFLSLFIANIYDPINPQISLKLPPLPTQNLNIKESF